MSMFPQPFHSLPVLALDTETTGIDSFEDRIVTCSMVYDDGRGSPQHIRNWMIDPGIEIPTGASDVHGVTTEVAREQGMGVREGLQSIADSLYPMMQAGIPLVVYNAPFDLTLIHAEFARNGIYFPFEFNRVIDPLVIDKQVDKFRKGKRTLGVTAAFYGYDLTNAHTAEADCIAAIAITRGFGERYGPIETIEEIHQKQIAWKYEQARSFQAYLRKEKDPEAVINGEWPVMTR